VRIALRRARVGVFFAGGVAQPWPVRGLLATAKASLARPAPDTQVKVIVVRVSTRRLMKNPRGSQHRLWRAFVARCVPEEARLELIRAEDPFHARLVIGEEGANQVPIARFVEAEDAVAQRREAEAIEAEPAVAVRGQAAGVSRKEQQVCVAPRAVGAMPGMCASVGGR
jgi:hypothetical protein